MTFIVVDVSEKVEQPDSCSSSEEEEKEDDDDEVADKSESEEVIYETGSGTSYTL